MPLRDARQWYDVLVQCQVKPAVAATWSEVFEDVVRTNSFNKGDAELDDFLGHILHESKGLTRMVEDLFYTTPERICRVWPSRFPTIASAQPYVRNPEALANKVYGGRMGNTQPGDGWKYRGRSPVGITGYDNYLRVGELVGQDLIVLPEILEQPRFALEATIAWWEDRIPDSMIGDPEASTKRVQGGLLGLTERTELMEDARRALA